jgi:hypothetical protein
MRDEDALILELCKAAPAPGAVSAIAARRRVDWDRFLDLAEEHQVAPLVLERLLACPHPAVPRDDLAPLARERVAWTLMRNRIYGQELRRVVGALAGRGIPCILMKGFSLPDADLRTMGDLDFLIRDADLERAMACLGAAGYAYVGHVLNRELSDRERRDLASQRSWNNQYQLYSEAAGVLLELHTNLFERERIFTVNLDALLDRVGDFWDGARPDDRLGCQVFGKEHLLLLMALHTAIKRSPANDTLRLRNLVDIDRLAAGAIGWENFLRAALAMRVAPFVLFALELARRLLGTQIPPGTLRALRRASTPAQAWLTQIHHRCVRSLGPSAPVAAALYRFLSPFVFQARLRDRLRWLFLVPVIAPPRWKMAQKFGIREDSRLIYATYVLNPLRWAWLLFKGGRGGRGESVGPSVRDKDEVAAR